MRSEDQFRLATLRLTDQVTHLTQLVTKMQKSLSRLEQENFNLKQHPLISNTSDSHNGLLFQPSPIKLFSSSPPPSNNEIIEQSASHSADEDLVMSYFCDNSPVDLDHSAGTIFKTDTSPMMGYYDTSMIYEPIQEIHEIQEIQGVINDEWQLQPQSLTLTQTPQVQTLTKSRTHPHPHPHHRKVTRKTSGPLKILIVEDDPLCQTLISHIIKSLHIGQCEVVADGVEAVINMSTNYFDLILMDMQLPHLDGLQATQNIRKFNRRTPIVSMTARLGEEDIRRYFEGGIDEVLPKPFDKQSVRRIIEQFYKLTINEDPIEEIKELEEAIEATEEEM